MAVLVLTKDVTIDPHCGFTWFSKGQGIVGRITGDDGTFLSVVTESQHETINLTVPKDCVRIVENPEPLDNPPGERCDHCGQLHQEKAVWRTEKSGLVCNVCWATYFYHTEKLNRYELDPETGKWVKTAALD